MVAVSVSHAPKVRASPVHRATTHPHHAAAMAHKAHRVLKAKATVAEKVAAVMAAAVKSSAAIRVLTTVAMAKAVRHLVVRVLKAVAQVVVHKAGGKTVATTMTSCHATSIL